MNWRYSMLAFTSIIFAVCFVVYGVIGDPISEENRSEFLRALPEKARDIATDTILTYIVVYKTHLFNWSVPLPCKFDVYDLNSNTVISVEEFMSATKGFTKMDRKTLFELVDRNGDMVIGVDEFKSVPQSIMSAGILDHCLRIKMFKGGCIGIGWGK